MKTLVLHAQWVCQVTRSGYHNGAGCSPSDPHQTWECGYRHELSLPAQSATATLTVGVADAAETPEGSNPRCTPKS